MSIYNVDGDILYSAKNIVGESIRFAYDLSGNVIAAETYDISNVVSYYQAETLAMQSEIDALSDDWQTFVFITDPHSPANQQHSQAIALYLLANSKADKIILGGDIVDSIWPQNYSLFVTPFRESYLKDNIYCVMGNHETFGGGYASAASAIYNDFLADKTGLSGNLQDNYWYFDDSERKVRWVFLNTSDGRKTDSAATAAVTVSNDQLTWLQNAVVLPDSSWSLLVIGHVTIYGQYGSVNFTGNVSNGADVISAINQCNGDVIGYFCGHQHVNAVSDTGLFYQATMRCDRFENTNYYGLSYTERVAGTRTEQSVEVVSFNTKTKDVLIRGIGGGNADGDLNARMSFNYGR